MSNLPDYGCDLSDETPSNCGDFIKREPAKLSRIGHAAVFVGKARELAEQNHVDVHSLVNNVFRQRGISDEQLPALAVIVHHPEENELMPAGFERAVAGWVRAHELTLIASPNDGEGLVFSHAIHVVATPHRSSIINKIALHEAGHLDKYLRGERGRGLYTDANVRLMKRFGAGALAAAALTEIGALGGELYGRFGHLLPLWGSV